jgi:YVTN family beta-propeller protein
VATNTIVKTIVWEAERRIYMIQGIHPTDIAFTRDGKRAYITCGDANFIAILDVEKMEIVGTITNIGIAPVAIVISPDGKRAYFTNQYSEGITVIDIQTNTVVSRINIAR